MLAVLGGGARGVAAVCVSEHAAVLIPDQSVCVPPGVCVKLSLAERLLRLIPRR